MVQLKADPDSWSSRANESDLSDNINGRALSFGENGKAIHLSRFLRIERGYKIRAQ